MCFTDFLVTYHASTDLAIVHSCSKKFINSWLQTKHTYRRITKSCGFLHVWVSKL